VEKKEGDESKMMRWRKTQEGVQALRTRNLQKEGKKNFFLGLRFSQRPAPNARLVTAKGEDCSGGKEGAATTGHEERGAHTRMRIALTG